MKINGWPTYTKRVAKGGQKWYWKEILEEEERTGLGKGGQTTSRTR